MDAGYISAVPALAGSAIGALASPHPSGERA